MKKPATVLNHFGLDCEMLEFFNYFTHKPPSKEQLLTLPYIWSPGLGEKIAVCGLCPYNPSAKEVGGLDGFLYEAAQNFLPLDVI